MDWFVKAFIRASLFWFATGIALGVAMAVHPRWVVYRPAHAHLNVAGFLTMLVFGVGYQLLPRMFGHPLYSRRLAVAHLVLANLGLASLVAGFIVRAHRWDAGQGIAAVGGLLFAAGAVIWIGNLWRTFGMAEVRQRSRAQSGGPQLPTLNPPG